MDINKVRLQKLNNLFLLTYYNHPLKNNNSCITKQNPAINDYGDNYIETKEIDIYIDIPTIDHYNDEITHNKIMKFNKKFKVHTLKDSIFSKFEISDQEANSANSPMARIYKLSIRSSGSLRYVGTIKYIVEECYNRLLQKIKSKNDLKQKIELHVSIQVTPTSLRWFKTFLKAELLHGDKINDKNRYLNCFIDFPLVGNSIAMDKVAKPAPFKDYYLKLSSLFQDHEHDSSMDLSSISKNWNLCVIVITNSAGVKALLTMLSDKPLDSFLTEDSLVNIIGSRNNQCTKDNCSRYHQKTRGRLMNEKKREFDSVSPLGRRDSSEQRGDKAESYELEEQKEQQQDITGCQSRAVRQDKEGKDQNVLFSEDIPKLRRDSSSLLSFQDISSNKDKSIRVIPSNTSIKSLNYVSIQDGIRRRGYESGSIGGITNNPNKEEPLDAVDSLSDQDTYEDDYEDEDEDNDDEDNDLGIILHIPTYSQRVQNRELPTSVADKLQKYSLTNKPEIKVEDKPKPEISAPEQEQLADSDDKYYSEENMEDAMCSTKENSHQLKGNYYSNIYKHDGEFDRYNRNNNNNNYYYHRNSSGCGSNNSMNSLLLSTAIRKINARSRRNTLLKKNDNTVPTTVPFNSSPSNNNSESGIITTPMANSPNFNYSNNSSGTNRNFASNNIHNNSTMADDSLIPPEFYSRISSPASSRDNSDISLASALFNNNNNNTNSNTITTDNNNNNNNMRLDSFSELAGGLGTNTTNTINNYVPPEIFTKYLTTGDPQHILSSTANNTNKNVNNNTTVFNAKLINKSFAEFNKESKNVPASLSLDNGVEESQFFRLGFKKKDETDDTTASISTIADGEEDFKSDVTTSSTTSTLHKPNLTGLDIYGGSNSNINDSANNTTWDYAGNEYSEDEEHIKTSNDLNYSEKDINYSDSTISNNKSVSNEDIKDETQEKDNIGAYKKPAFTLDLYGDDDKDNADVWFLGGNKK